MTNSSGPDADALPLKPSPEPVPTVLFGAVFSAWWFFVSAGAVLPILPAFIHGQLGGGSLGIGWVYFLDKRRCTFFILQVMFERPSPASPRPRVQHGRVWPGWQRPRYAGR